MVVLTKRDGEVVLEEVLWLVRVTHSFDKLRCAFAEVFNEKLRKYCEWDHSPFSSSLDVVDYVIHDRNCKVSG